MIAIPTSGPISGTQLLTWTRSTDLCSSKSVNCNRLVEAGELSTRHIYTTCVMRNIKAFSGVTTFIAGLIFTSEGSKDSKLRKSDLHRFRADDVFSR